ncbi:DUF6973 domain-containing protein [Nocardia amikacinitolerans]|uniref:DUF6973 domain-containing protein n=1 Tax=Nocardia amikacinitolerans TaxID=756689 RepID=UPI0020A30EAC|nr:hypothetical protein [Nocardia amikacinitolerans]MCP2291115.1 hypothetical protein [Nocardia amikacinitolerans]
MKHEKSWTQPFSVPRAKSLDLGAISLQSDLWQSQSQAIARMIENQNNSVNNSRDFWQGASGNGFRTAFIPLYQGGKDLQQALADGASAARAAVNSLQRAQSAVNTAVQAAHSDGYEVADDGTCTVSQQSQQILLASLSAAQVATGLASLQQNADAHTANIQQALAQLSDEDESARQSIENAFSGIRTVDKERQDYPGAGTGTNEVRACASHPVDCSNSKRRGAMDIPWSESEKYFPSSEGYTGADDRRDACRHCIWMAMMTAWGTESFARDMADAHEIDSPSAPDDPQYSEASKRMDLYNNETGIAVGLRHDDDTAGIVAECVAIARNARKVPMSGVPDISQNPGKNSLIFFNGPE